MGITQEYRKRLEKQIKTRTGSVRNVFERNEVKISDREKEQNHKAIQHDYPFVVVARVC